MILYLDTSALVKMFVAEAHSDVVKTLVADAKGVATSRITYAEACAAFARRVQQKEITKKEFARAFRLLSKEWPFMQVMEVDEITAGQKAIQHGLRGFDALHLVAGLNVRAKLDDSLLGFCSFDDQQRKAARAEGLIVLPKKLA